MSEHSRPEADIEAELTALRTEYHALESARRFYLEPERLATLDKKFAALDKQIAAQQEELLTLKANKRRIQRAERSAAEAKKRWLLEAELASTRAENGLLKTIDGIDGDLAALLREYPRQHYPYLLEEIQWIKEEVAALRKKISVPEPDTFLFAGSALPGRREDFAELISATLAAAPRERSGILRLELELVALRAENYILKDIKQINNDLSALLSEQPRVDYSRLLERIEWIRNNLAVQRQEEIRQQKIGESDEDHAGGSLEEFLSSAEGRDTPI